MEQKNRYYRRAHVSERKFRQLVNYFARDLPAADVAQLTGLTRKSVTTIFLKLRQRIAEHYPANQPNPDFDPLSEEFQDFSDKRLSKFRGVSEHTMQWHLRECEWRFRRRQLNTEDLARELLKLLEEHPL